MRLTARFVFAVIMLLGAIAPAAALNLQPYTLQTFGAAYGAPTALPGANVTVYLYGTTTKANLYSFSSGVCSGSIALSNPLTSDASGLVSFCADASSQYQATWSLGSYTSPTVFVPTNLGLPQVGDWHFGGSTTFDGATLFNSPVSILSTSTAAAAVTNTNLSFAPSSITTKGASYTNFVRTGGVGQYGLDLLFYEISAALPAGQLDIGRTSWLGAQNLTGGSVFGGWTGANSPSYYQGHAWTAGGVVGTEFNFGNRWGDPGLQTDVGSGRYTVGLQLVPDVLPSRVRDLAGVTISAASPAVVTFSSHHAYVGQGIVFAAGGGTLPPELTAETVYYVGSVIDSSHFTLSASIGGALINTSAPSSGAVNAVLSWPGSFGLVFSHSIWGHQLWTSTLIRPDTLMAGGIGVRAAGGSNAVSKPAAYLLVQGLWSAGLDFTGATFDFNAAIRLGNLQTISFGSARISGTSAGAISLTTGTTGVTGVLSANNYAQNAILWSSDGSNPALGFYGGTPVPQPTGYGTPTGASKVANFPGASATLLQTSQTLAALIADLQSSGLIGH